MCQIFFVHWVNENCEGVFEMWMKNISISLWKFWRLRVVCGWEWFLSRGWGPFSKLGWLNKHLHTYYDQSTTYFSAFISVRNITGIELQEYLLGQWVSSYWIFRHHSRISNSAINITFLTISQNFKYFSL